MTSWDSQIYLWEEQMSEYEQIQSDIEYWGSGGDQ
jgi:hypothetical protein